MSRQVKVVNVNMYTKMNMKKNEQSVKGRTVHELSSV